MPLSVVFQLAQEALPEALSYQPVEELEIVLPVILEMGVTEDDDHQECSLNIQITRPYILA
jgi:hypothetical protein